MGHVEYQNTAFVKELVAQYDCAGCDQPIVQYDYFVVPFDGFYFVNFILELNNNSYFNAKVQSCIWKCGKILIATKTDIPALEKMNSESSENIIVSNSHSIVTHKMVYLCKGQTIAAGVKVEQGDGIFQVDTENTTLEMILMAKLD